MNISALHLEIVFFDNKYKEDFKRLNEQWITQYFEIEQEDVIAFSHPEKIVEGGGDILVALLGDEVVGVCAIKKHNDTRYELSKFAVDSSKRGFGIGNELMKKVIETAHQKNIPLMFLEGNTTLESSIHLYRKFGFKEIPLEVYDSHYKRVDIVMEWKP